MGVIERDSLTGHGTTGHEWNGIKELNTAVPRLVWGFLIAAVIFSIVWWILMPAWPLGTSYTKGVLGADVRRNVAVELRAAKEKRAVWATRIDTEDYAAIQADPDLMEVIRETGHALFGDNCAACHGIGAKGGPGFPNLTDNAWLWGGKPDTIFDTIRIGVNSEHPDSRVSQMPAWGRDQMLNRDAISEVTAYVYSLSHSNGKEHGAADKSALGEKVFANNCAACHGADAKGNAEIGAPDLTDGRWLYGGDEASIYASVYGGRQGQMPTWENRISATDRKILTLYLLDLKQTSP